MKTMMTLIIMIFAVSAQAKVSDFNSMIEENAKEQKQLHKELKGQINELHKAINEERFDKSVVMEAGPTDYAVPTNKDMLTYEKEKSAKSQQSKKDLHRLSTDIKEMNQEF